MGGGKNTRGKGCLGVRGLRDSCARMRLVEWVERGRGLGGSVGKAVEGKHNPSAARPCASRHQLPLIALHHEYTSWQSRSGRLAALWGVSGRATTGLARGGRPHGGCRVQ